MNQEDLIKNHTIYTVRTGSQAYGIAHADSDLDIKGLFLPPRAVDASLFNKVEQVQNSSVIESNYKHLANPENPKIESTIFSLRKFMMLASAVNPNLIELLWIDPSDLLFTTGCAEELVNNRGLFLSSKARYTFSGYAIAQLDKIKRHRAWLLNPPSHQPTRAEFNLDPTPIPQFDELERTIKREIELWSFSDLPLDEMSRNDLKERCWTLVRGLTGLNVSWDNWPQAHWQASFNVLAKEFNFKEEVIEKIQREKRYREACRHYAGYMNWSEHRNSARKTLEETYKYDVKHAAHLVRLLRMGVEILETGTVKVKRPDAEELRAIRNGSWTYEQVEAYADEMNAKLESAYKTTILPREVDNNKIEELFQTLISKYQP